MFVRPGADTSIEFDVGKSKTTMLVANTIWVLGRDFDAQGQPLPGARIQSTIDLISRGLAWHPGIESTPEFFELSKELKRQFMAL